MGIIYQDIISLKIMMNLKINSINFLIRKRKLMMKIVKQIFVLNSINLKFVTTIYLQYLNDKNNNM